MDKKGRTVYLYVDLYLSWWQRPIIPETQDSTIQPALLALLTRLVYSQTEKTVNTRNISGMLLCCAKNKQTNKKQ